MIAAQGSLVRRMLVDVPRWRRSPLSGRAGLGDRMNEAAGCLSVLMECSFFSVYPPWSPHGQFCLSDLLTQSVQFVQLSNKISEDSDVLLKRNH